MEKLKTYYLEINENDETGVDFVAFVDKPAIEVNWKAFASDVLKTGDKVVVKKGKEHDPSHLGMEMEVYEVVNGAISLKMPDGGIHKWYVPDELEKVISKNHFSFKTTNEDRRIVSGALMLANTPIYRRDDMYGEYQVVFTPETIEKIVNKFFKNGNQKNVNGMHNQNFVIDGVYMFESFIVDKSRGIKAPKGFEDMPEGSWFGSFKVENEQIWNDYVKSGVFKGFSVEGMFNQSLTPTDEYSAVYDALKEFAKAMDLNTLEL